MNLLIDDLRFVVLFAGLASLRLCGEKIFLADFRRIKSQISAEKIRRLASSPIHQLINSSAHQLIS
jgi:hypothetical protein